jgi:hypothetical protein
MQTSKAGRANKRVTNQERISKDAKLVTRGGGIVKRKFV